MRASPGRCTGTEPGKDEAMNNEIMTAFRPQTSGLNKDVCLPGTDPSPSPRGHVTLSYK